MLNHNNDMQNKRVVQSLFALMMRSPRAAGNATLFKSVKSGQSVILLS